MYPKTPGCFSDLSAALYYKSYCFFLKLLIVLPVHFPLLHFTPPKVLRFYYNLTFRCVRYFGGSAKIEGLVEIARVRGDFIISYMDKRDNGYGWEHGVPWLFSRRMY